MYAHSKETSYSHLPKLVEWAYKVALGDRYNHDGKLQVTGNHNDVAYEILQGNLDPFLNECQIRELMAAAFETSAMRLPVTDNQNLNAQYQVGRSRYRQQAVCCLTEKGDFKVVLKNILHMFDGAHLIEQIQREATYLQHGLATKNN